MFQMDASSDTVDANKMLGGGGTFLTENNSVAKCLKTKRMGSY